MIKNTQFNDYEISPEEELILLGLSRIKGFGPVLFKNLFKEIGSVRGIVEKKYKKNSIKEEIVKEIKANNIEAEALKYAKKLESINIRFITIFDDKYPDLLREIYDPPLVIYIKGDFCKEEFKRCFAVVGTRKSTQYGFEVTRKLVKGLVDTGFVIVSGMAFGIDKEVHRSAIEFGGRTIAVLSGGVDKPSPLSNRNVYEEITNNGFIVSEAPIESDITQGSFPRRNRIISGISLGTLVIEAGKKSGALITSRQALEQGREVFAVPGSIFSPASIGTNNLIKSGEAKLVNDINDILEEYGFENKHQSGINRKSYSGEEQEVINFLIQNQASMDEIAVGLGLSINKIARIMSMMEIENKVAKTFDNRYVILN